MQAPVMIYFDLSENCSPSVQATNQLDANGAAVGKFTKLLERAFSDQSKVAVDITHRQVEKQASQAIVCFSHYFSRQPVRPARLVSVYYGHAFNHQGPQAG